MSEKKYYTIEEALAFLGKHGLTINIIASYARDRLIHPLIYINSSLAHACERGDDGSAIAVGICFLSAYWDLNREIVAILDNILNSEDGSIDIHPLVKKELLLEEPQIFGWQNDVSSFANVQPQYVNPKPYSPDLDIKYFMLVTKQGIPPKLKLSNILLRSNDFELLKQHFTTAEMLPQKILTTANQKKVNSSPKANNLLDLITDLYKTNTDKTPRSIWNKLKELSENDHSFLQEVDSITKIDAAIRWISHTKKEKSLKLPRFRNIISDLNKT